MLISDLIGSSPKFRAVLEARRNSSLRGLRGSHTRRDGHRQGSDRTSHSRCQPAATAAVCGDQLRGDSCRAARE